MGAPEQEPPPCEVSVVVPAWGAYAGTPLAEALASVRAQEVGARLIVVDNASHQRVDAPEADEVVRSADRLTLGAARNLGLQRVETPYVLFWDADDLMLPGTLRRLQSRIAGDPDIVAVTAAILEDNPRVPHRWPRRWAARLSRRPLVFALCHCVWGIYPTIGSTILRTATVREAGGFGGGHGGDDWVLGVSLAFRGRVVFDREPGRLYRQHAGSLLRQSSSTRQLLRLAAAVRARIRGDAGLPTWVRLLLPAITAAQLIAVLCLRPIARARRSLFGGAAAAPRPADDR